MFSTWVRMDRSMCRQIKSLVFATLPPHLGRYEEWHLAGRDLATPHGHGAVGASIDIRASARSSAGALSLPAATHHPGPWDQIVREPQAPGPQRPGRRHPWGQRDESTCRQSLGSVQ